MKNADFSTASRSDRMFAAFQKILPTRFLSWCVFKLTRITAPRFKNALIRLFVRAYRIDMNQARVREPTAYIHFNDFFTRALKDGARPLAADKFVSPVDGTISQLGKIDSGSIIQAKGHRYTTVELLGGGMENATPFLGGSFCTIYLAPHNYHRIHMPVDGTLRWWRYIPGRLFSVNPATVRALPNLFARNERVACVFDTEKGPLAMVLVGALFVGSIETVWAGQITPPHKRHDDSGNYLPMTPVSLKRGQEMGRFNMGSTVILLGAPYVANWAARLRAGDALRMGEELGW